MKFLIQLFATAAALAVLIALMLAPATPVLPSNPLSILGVALIGLGLIRHVQQSADAATAHVKA
ncbi:MAG: hypothetical protein AAF333_15175 [Planctomycetota bacterium]